MSHEDSSALLDSSEWESLLGEALGYEVRVRYGHARRTVLQVQDLCQAPPPLRRPPGVGLYLRMNAFFAGAPAEVRQATVSWIRSGRRARRAARLLDRWIESQVAGLERARPRRVRLRPRGRCHDLAPLAEDLLGTCLAGDFPDPDRHPRITWGRAGRSRSRHSLRLGSYDYHSRVVRIHRVLDQPAVPRWFVRYVLFHELLHAVLDDRAPTEGRHRHHGPLFREREDRYPDYQQALSWEREHLPELIRSARSGRPIEGTVAAVETGASVQGGWVQGTLFG